MGEKRTFYETLVRSVSGVSTAIGRNCITGLHTVPFLKKSAVLSRVYDSARGKYGRPAIKIERLTLTPITRNNLSCHTIPSLWFHGMYRSHNRSAESVGVRI